LQSFGTCARNDATLHDIKVRTIGSARCAKARRQRKPIYFLVFRAPSDFIFDAANRTFPVIPQRLRCRTGGMLCHIHRLEKFFAQVAHKSVSEPLQ
jgi:hypothetical protein